MQIFKYELPVQDEVVVSMPMGAAIISAQAQRGAVTLWAEIDPAARRIARRFRIVGTGHEFDRTGLRYVGTVQTGVFVWHVYEMPN
jgi:hypothetical protein